MLVIASIALGITTGVMVAVVTMRHLLHTKDARIKILNEKIEALDKWSDTLFNEEDMQKAYMEGYWQASTQDMPLTFNEWLQTTYRPVEKVQKPVDQVIVDMTVQAQHKESMNYWTAEGEIQHEDKRTGPTC